jgi:zinc protease
LLLPFSRWPACTLPAAEVVTLPSGARLHVLANDAQPVVRLQVVLRAGKTVEPRPGLATLTARMLLEGTTTRTARQIADEVAFYGASLECDAGLDRSTHHAVLPHAPPAGAAAAGDRTC